MEKLLHNLDVSRETIVSLEQFVSLLLKWNKAINLIGKSTEKEIWTRHILDSLQILPIVKNKTILDIGTGAGFPGMVLAIAGAAEVHLVEKNNKKCAFLYQLKSLISTNSYIYNEKIEDVKTFTPDIITCRAFAPIVKILQLIERFITKDSILVLLKGENYDAEIKEAEDMGWIFEYNISESITESKAVVLSLSNIKRND